MQLADGKAGGAKKAVPVGLQRMVGFTVIELLVAMSILSLLGLMVITMLRSGTRIWQRAEARRNQNEKVLRVFNLLREDLAHLASPSRRTPDRTPGVKFIADQGTDSQRLMFVRYLGDYRRVHAVRLAGNARDDDQDDMADEEVFNFMDEDGDGLVDEDLEAMGGYMAVAYTLNDRTLYRGVRSPVSQMISDLFETDGLHPVADGVLYFGLRFWGPMTATWDEAATGGPTGPEVIWDSTRGILDNFTYALGAESAAQPGDDIFPSKVQVHLVLFHERLHPQSVTTALIDDADVEIAVVHAALFEHLQDPYVRIGREWMKVEGVEDGRLIISERGARQTTPSAHPAGVEVNSGRIFHMTLPVPDR